MSKDYYVEINGEKIRVTEDVYRAYMRPIWREEKRAKVLADRECPFDSFAGGIEGFPSPGKLVEEIAEDNMLLETLLSALEALTTDERTLIDALFFHELSEQAVAIRLGLSKQAVNLRKWRALRKLKIFLEKFEK